MSERLRWVFSFVGFLTFLLLPSVAQAGWLSPVDVSEVGEHVGSPHVVLDSAGNATAVWDRWSGTHTVVESAYRPAGQGWQPPVDLSSAEEAEGPGGEAPSGAHSATSPQVAVDGSGDTTVVWERSAGTNRIILQATYRPAGGSWQAPVSIGEVKTMWAPEPWIAVDAQGDATAVWTNAGVIESAYQPAGSSWQPPVPISDPKSESYVPEAAVNAQGDATAVWMHYDGSRYVVQSAYRPAGGSWEAPTLVSEPGEEGGNPHISLGVTGDAVVVWRGGSEDEEAVRSAFKPAEGGWGQPASASVPGDQVQFPRAALDVNGNAIVVWASSTHELGGHTVVLGAYRPAGGSWEAPTLLSEAGGNAFPSDLAFDASGNSAVVWSRDDGENSILQAAYRPAEGSWEAPADLSEKGSDATNAVVVLGASGESTAAKGVATAVWISSGSSSCGEKAPCVVSRVQAAGYDAFNAPAEGLSVPPTGKAGAPVEVSVPPANIWMPRIDFGDGSSAASTNATHTYDEPGTYTVSFTGTEVLGYSSSAQRKITIGPADPADDSPGPKGDPSPVPPPQVASADGSSQQPQGDPSLAPPPPVVCGVAQRARESALRQLRLTRAKLRHAPAAEIKKLRGQSRKWATALRRATRRASAACDADG